MFSAWTPHIRCSVMKVMRGLSVCRGQPSKFSRGIRVEQSVVPGAIASGHVDSMGDGATLSIREVGVFRYQHGVPHDSRDWRVGVMSLGLCNDRCARGEPADCVCYFLLLERVGRVR